MTVSTYMCVFLFYSSQLRISGIINFNCVFNPGENHQVSWQESVFDVNVKSLSLAVFLSVVNLKSKHRSDVIQMFKYIYQPE